MNKKYILILILLISSSYLTACISAEHEHIACDICGKCIAEDCSGLEEEKCQGHQKVHVHVKCQECGKCIAEDCSGLEEEKCQGHNYFISLESKQYISFTDSLEDLKFYIIQNYSQFTEFISENEIKEIYYDESNNVNYNENVANSFNEEFFIDNAVILISYYTETSLKDLTIIKSYKFENGILNIKFGVTKTDLIPTNNCYLIYMFKCNKHTLADLITVEYKFGVKN